MLIHICKVNVKINNITNSILYLSVYIYLLLLQIILLLLLTISKLFNYYPSFYYC